MLTKNSPPPALVYCLGLAVGITYLLMVWGNLVTSTDSGLACPDWPLCYGSVAPPLNIHIWLEWGHRLLGGLAGILILLSTIFVWRNYHGIPRYLTAAVMGLLLMGVLMGGVIIITDAPLLDNLIRVGIVSSHLVLSTLILVCLIFTFRYVAIPAIEPGDRPFDPILFFAVYLMVILGILVRYSGASLACPDFPQCNGEWMPPEGDNLAALHMAHRFLALVIFVLSLAILCRALVRGKGRVAHLLTFSLVTLQAMFGAMIVMSGMFLPVVILHGATGFLLLAWLAYQSMPYFFRQGKREKIAETGTA